MEKEFALKIWESIYGDRLWAADCFGTWLFGIMRAIAEERFESVILFKNL